MKAFIVLTILVIQKITPAIMLPSGSSENVFREQAIIQTLIEKENEVVMKEDQQRIKPRSPQYPIEILKQFEHYSESASTPKRNDDIVGSSVSLKVQNQVFFKPRERLFHVWLPSEIIDAAAANMTLVKFQQNMPRHYFGNFTSSQITLTLLPDVQLSPRTYLKIYTQWENNGLQMQSIQTLHIKKRRKFHSFNITDFISVCLKDNLTEPNFITIGFQAYKISGRNQTKLDFSRLFDAQVNMPLIMYFYGGFVPSEVKMQSSRRKRSIMKRKFLTGTNARPTSQCQRRSFTVRPKEVDWNDVVEPEILDIGYCSGTCPFPLEDDYYNFTLHSFLMDRYRLHHILRLPTDFPHSRCVPSRYKSVTVLETTGPDQIEAGVVHNLIVDTCACR